MSTRCNIAIRLRESDLDRELSFDDIHFLKTQKEFQFMEVYCHHDGYPDNARDFFYNKAHLDDYESVLNYILQGDRTNFDVPYMECGEQWSDNRPYMYATLDSDIPNDYYYIFMDGKWYYKQRVSANDQQREWIPLEPPVQLEPSNDSPDLAYIEKEMKALVEKLTEGKYTFGKLSEDMLLEL